MNPETLENILTMTAGVAGILGIYCMCQGLKEYSVRRSLVNSVTLLFEKGQLKTKPTIINIYDVLDRTY